MVMYSKSWFDLVGSTIVLFSITTVLAFSRANGATSDRDARTKDRQERIFIDTRPTEC